MKKKLLFPRLLIFLVAAVCFKASAQTKLPNYIPPSPLASSFKIYGDIPVSYSTGVPDISVPLYTIQVGDYALPITLRYHVKSLKPANCRSNVALGWSLDYGGMVSRTVIGKMDNGMVATFNPSQSQGTASNEELMNMYVSHGVDSEHDLFNFSIPGASGEFIMDDNFQPYLMSKHPVNIRIHGNHSDDNIDIRDEKGGLYKFGYGNIHWFDEYGLSKRTSWLLSQIALPSNKVIDFTYENIPRFDERPQGRSLSILMSDQQRELHGMSPILQPPHSSLPPGDPSMNLDVSLSDIFHHEKNIKEIIFESGRIVFTLSSDKRLITGMEVYSSAGLLKSYRFVLSADAAMGDMKLLEKIIVKDKAFNTVNEYQFRYQEGSYVSANAGTDYWGYYNGEPFLSFPCDTYTYNAYNPFGGLTPGEYDDSPYCQNKDASEVHSLYHSLKKIIYPTKGETEFLFELNEFGSASKPRGDGLRITKITNHDGMGGSSIKTFTYEEARNVPFAPNKREFATTSFDVFETEHTEQGKDNPTDASLKPNPTYTIIKAKNTTYQSSVSSRILGLIMTSNYSKVTETIGENDHSIGSNIYYYQYNDHDLQTNTVLVEGPSYYLSKYKNWGTGLIYRKEVYRENETVPLTVTDYNYIYHYDGQSFKNTVSVR